MAKDPVRLRCGTCGGPPGTIQKQYKGVYDPKTGKTETVYRTEKCGRCNGGYIN